jgi:hypothetical protein
MKTAIAVLIGHRISGICAARSVGDKKQDSLAARNRYTCRSIFDRELWVTSTL